MHKNLGRGIGMEGQGRATRAAGWGFFGGAAALITGSTPIGVAIVAAVGAGLALAAWGRDKDRGTGRPSAG